MDLSLRKNSYAILNAIEYCISSNAKSKDVLWKFIKKFHKEINPQNHKILDELTKYAINYFEDEVEPKKKFKKPNKTEKKALENLILQLNKVSQNTPC